MHVTPFAGVWIEISMQSVQHLMQQHVTPFAGVWIEI